MNTNTRLVWSLLAVSAILSLFSCEKDSDQAALKSNVEGYLSIDVVVNPLIHPYAESYALTMDEVRIEGLENETLLSNQDFHFAASLEPIRHTLQTRAVLSPGRYSTMEADFNTTASNGCTITTYDGLIDALGVGNDPVFTVQIGGNYLIKDGVTTKRILLLDLNELISTTTDGQTDFSFRENLATSNKIQLYDPAQVGHISGTLVRNEDTPRQTYRLVAYAYPIGSFDKQVEIQNGFKSATISANVGRTDRLILPVLKEGIYDLVIAHYVDEDQNGILEFKELLQADADIGSNTRMTLVKANTETTILMKVGGVVVD